MDDVRKIIRNVLLEGTEILSERLMDVGDDVNYIYDNYFRAFIEETELTRKLNMETLISGVISTSELKSPLATKANKINQCDIAINEKEHGFRNFYHPIKKLISLGVNASAFQFAIGSHSGFIDRAARGLAVDFGETKSKVFLKEFSESKIKGSIHHELAHWIDDTLHNSHIKHRALKVKEGGVTDMTIKGLPINADYLEIQAQIHNVLQLKNKYEDIWDDITFMDLVEISPTLHGVYNTLKNSVRDKWIRDLKTRMYREGLLGVNMINK